MLRSCSQEILTSLLQGEVVTKILLSAGADTGEVDRVDIHPPFFSKKKNSKCHFI